MILVWSFKSCGETKNPILKCYLLRAGRKLSKMIINKQYLTTK